MGAGRHGGMFFSAGVADGKSGIDGLNQYAYSGNTTQPQNGDGFSVKPQKGDVFIAGGGNYGHVAIVAEVTDTSIRIAQQNMAGQGFIFDIPMSLQSNGKWRLQYGIMHVSGLLRQP